MKDGMPIGDVVYEKDGHAIYKIDGEEHKVCINVASSVRLRAIHHKN